MQDLRYAAREMRKRPGLTLTAVLSLALGIGATTAVFSVVYAVLMNPYPYRDADQLVQLLLVTKAGTDRGMGLTGPQIQEFRKASCVESIAAYEEWNLTTTDHDLPEDVTAYYFTGNASSHFGVPALLGRGLIPSDAPDGHDPQPVVVLGYLFWQRYFNGDRDVLGHTLQLVHKNYTIVGVMPPRFTWGDGDVYLPLKITQDPNRRFGALFRLKPGIAREAVNAEFQPLVERFDKELPVRLPEGFRVRVRGLNDQVVKQLGHTLYLLLGAVGVLLIIGCANVSILLLARGTARQQELAVRAAIGASRFRILRQLLTESLALSVAGTALGVLLAYRTLALIVAWLPEYSFPHEAAIRIDLPVLLFSITLAMLTGILFGISPALQFSRPQLAQVMQSNTRKMTGGARGKRMHAILVAGQIALTMVLLSAAGAAMAGFLHLVHTNLGYDPHNTMSVGIPVHDNTYMTWERRAVFFDQIRRRIAAMPEVLDAGISTNATPPFNGWDSKFEILGGHAQGQQELRTNFVSPEYFTVLRIPLLQGRLWDQAESIRGAHVAVINQTMARTYWPKGDAIGSQMRLPDMKPRPPYGLAAPGSDGWLQIVGVVGDARDDGLRKPVKAAVYVPYTMVLNMFTQILVRARVDPLSVLRSVRAEILKIDPDQQVIANVRNLDQWITRQREWAQERLVATLFGAFSILALVLASVGLYSVVSYSVAQRTNEFGIRMALGARRGDVLLLVFRSTALRVGSGLVAGVALSLILSRVSADWAEGSSRDPLILLGVTALLVAASVLACVVPSRRASSVDPMSALRYE